MTDAAIAPSSYDEQPLVEATADLLGEPMLPNWWTAEVVEAEHDGLAFVARVAAAAAIGVLQSRGTSGVDVASQVFAVEMVALDDAMRDYTRRTNRGDVLPVALDILATAGGANLAGLLTGMLRRVRGE